jgi:hypothetical protein
MRAESLVPHQTDDGVYTLALVAGCFVGIGLAWQAVLSDGARERVIDRLFGWAEDGVSSAVDSPRQPISVPDPSSKAPAIDTHTTAPEPSIMSVAAVERQALPAPPLPERLELGEDEILSAYGQAKPTIATEIVFAMNSSFLLPADIAVLHRIVAAVPASGPFRLNLAATVSDDPVKNGPPAEAQRYNHWLAQRRADRVAEWLRRQTGGRAQIEIDFLPHDSSRRVRVGVWPVP